MSKNVSKQENPKGFFLFVSQADSWKKDERQKLQSEVKSVTVALLPRGTLG